MQKCKYFKSCSVFKKDKENNLNRPMSVLNHYQRTYCFNEPKKCARYQLMESDKNIKLPVDLLPNENKRVSKIINNQ